MYYPDFIVFKFIEKYIGLQRDKSACCLVRNLKSHVLTFMHLMLFVLYRYETIKVYQEWILCVYHSESNNRIQSYELVLLFIVEV